MKGWKSILLVFKFFMVLIYIALGGLMLFFDAFPLPVSKAGRIIFGIILVLYGTFRIYSVYKFLQAERDEE
jgi:hypothetical protein